MRQGRINATPTGNICRGGIHAALARMNCLKPGTHKCVPYVPSNRWGGINAAPGQGNRLKPGTHKCVPCVWIGMPPRQVLLFKNRELHLAIFHYAAAARQPVAHPDNQK